MNLLIIGAGGHGKCCYDIAVRMNCFTKIEFVDDSEEYVLGKKVIGKQSDLESLCNMFDYAFVAIGNNQVRKSLYDILSLMQYRKVNLLDPSAVVSSFAKLGEGIVVFPNAVIEASAVIDDGCIVSANSIVHHDAMVKEYALIYGNCIIRPMVKIQSFTVVKSGTVVENC